jgi:lipopolysaccharide cholinephosphotransferase
MQDIGRLRRAQLYMAKEIKRVCEKYNIEYFLYGGSVLGAIRHGGYIPWDDDMDIGMMDAEYRRFAEAVKEEWKDDECDFFLDTYETNKEYALLFPKVRLKGTKFIELKGNPNALHNEIFVDIFPFYYVSDSEFKRKLEGFAMLVLAQAIMSKSGYKVWKGDGWAKRLKFIPTDILGKIFSKKQLYKWNEKLFYKNKDTKRVYGGNFHGRMCFDRKLLEEFTDVKFENEFFKIPKDYDTFLKVAYGDYMKLPPVEDRVTHEVQCLDFGNFSG